MFAWVLGGLAAIIATGFIIINWNEIKEWVIDTFDRLSLKVRLAFANLIYKFGELIEKIFFVEDGKPKVIEGNVQPLEDEKLWEAYQNGELSREQYESLQRQMSVEVARIER